MISPVCNWSIDTDFCTYQTCCIQQGMVQYLPSIAGNAVYTAIFAVLGISQLALGIYYRTWEFMGPMLAGLFLEVIGYIGRLWMHNDIFSMSPFLMYLIPLTIGPAFFAAAIYLCLGRIVVVFGTHYSYFRPRTYTIVFVSCDFVSLLLQAIGGALTSTADTDSDRDTGVNIMIAGLVFQVFSLLLFMIAGVMFTWSVVRSSEPANPAYERIRQRFFYKAFLFSLAFATVTIFIRCCYRVAELQEGFDGSLANNETLFMVLEGPMVFAAIIALTLFHPGLGHGGHAAYQSTKFSFGGNKMSSESPNPVGRELDAEQKAEIADA